MNCESEDVYRSLFIVHRLKKEEAFGRLFVIL
jgi:hypothetical protein